MWPESTQAAPLKLTDFLCMATAPYLIMAFLLLVNVGFFSSKCPCSSLMLHSSLLSVTQIGLI